MTFASTLLLQARGLAFRHADGVDPLFRGLDLALYAGDRIAIVGANGSGKTTLVRVLLGELAPTDGSLHPSGAAHAWVRQEEPCGLESDLAAGPSRAHAPAGAPETAWHTLLRARPAVAELHAYIRSAEAAGVPDPLAYAEALTRYEELGGYRLERHARSEADAAGLDPARLDGPADRLSGGERRLVSLLGALLDPPAILALDEPTNHLDEDTVAWLIVQMRAHAGGSLIVSHDRWFLDQVGTDVLEIERGSVRQTRGTYAAHAAAREADRRYRVREKARHERAIVELRRAAHGYGVWAGRKEKEKSGAFDKGFIGARAARLQKRAVALRDRALAQAEELERVKPWVDKPRRLAFDPVRVSEGDCVVARGVRAGPVALPDLHVAWGERIAVVGPNGSGKTTLMRVLAGDLAPSSGTVAWAAGSRIGWLPQAVAGFDRRDTVASLFARVEEERARTLLGSLAVSAAEYQAAMHALSEGQIRKVALVRLMLDAPNVLLLDEPTTHLDVPSVEMLEGALAAFEGTLFLVTHDRYLRERTTARAVQLASQGTVLGRART